MTHSHDKKLSILRHYRHKLRLRASMRLATYSCVDGVVNCHTSTYLCSYLSCRYTYVHVRTYHPRFRLLMVSQIGSKEYLNNQRNLNGIQTH